MKISFIKLNLIKYPLFISPSLLKFNILLKNPLKFFRKNKLFGFLNIINISLFIYYIALVDPQNSNGTNYPIILFHTGFSFLCSFILGIYSYSLLGKIKKIINEEKESPKIAFEPSEDVNDALLIKKDNGELYMLTNGMYKIKLQCRQ